MSKRGTIRRKNRKSRRNKSKNRKIWGGAPNIYWGTIEFDPTIHHFNKKPNYRHEELYEVLQRARVIRDSMQSDLDRETWANYCIELEEVWGNLRVPINRDYNFDP
jgi:hypothetical protein